MDSVADRSTGQPVAAGAVEATVGAGDDSASWVVDVASGRVVRRSSSAKEPPAGAARILN
ncbi:MAG: hypothetical protein ACRDHF_09865 [Tepidiformaceae bacterium]